jgi:hypothetical protein
MLVVVGVFVAFSCAASLGKGAPAAPGISLRRAGEVARCNAGQVALEFLQAFSLKGL